MLARRIEQIRYGQLRGVNPCFATVSFRFDGHLVFIRQPEDVTLVGDPDAAQWIADKYGPQLLKVRESSANLMRDPAECRTRTRPPLECRSRSRPVPAPVQRRSPHDCTYCGHPASYHTNGGKGGCCMPRSLDRPLRFCECIGFNAKRPVLTVCRLRSRPVVCRTRQRSMPEIPTTSPAINAVRDFRRAHPGMIVFRKMGDFWEAFDDDARTVALALQIALTKRGGIPMAGIPYHCLDKWTQKLTDTGHKVVHLDDANTPQFFPQPACRSRRRQ